MSDMHDMFTEVIQSYAGKFSNPTDPGALVVMAIAEDLAAYQIEQLNLVQEYAVGTLVKRTANTSEYLDDVMYEDHDRNRALKNLGIAQHQDEHILGDSASGFRRALITHIYREWEEEVEPELDAALVALVESDV